MNKKHYMKQVYRFNIATKYSSSKINENSSIHCVHVLKRKEHCAVTSFHSDSRDLNFGISTWSLRALDVCWYQCSTLAAPETPYIIIKMHTEGYIKARFGFRPSNHNKIFNCQRDYRKPKKQGFGAEHIIQASSLQRPSPFSSEMNGNSML